MTKFPSKNPRQLEIPLLVNVNATDLLPQKHVLHQKKLISIDTRTDDDISLKATSEDLTIYRSISEGFFKRFR